MRLGFGSFDKSARPPFPVGGFDSFTSPGHPAERNGFGSFNLSRRAPLPGRGFSGLGALRRKLGLGQSNYPTAIVFDFDTGQYYDQNGASLTGMLAEAAIADGVPVTYENSGSTSLIGANPVKPVGPEPVHFTMMPIAQAATTSLPTQLIKMPDGSYIDPYGNTVSPSNAAQAIANGATVSQYSTGATSTPAVGGTPTGTSWFSGSTTLFGSTIPNSDLAVGGGIAALVIVLSKTGKKR